MCPSGPRNVTIDGLKGHACEDLITIGSPNASDITVKNSWLKAAPSKSGWDKTIQINFGRDIQILNNVFVGGLRCVRYKPGTNGRVAGNFFDGCETALQASSNDADVEPMKNGPVLVEFENNK